MNVSKLFPRRLRDAELYKEVIDILQWEVDNNEQEFLDVISKYTITDDTKEEVIQEILFEKGLDSLYELISLTPNADIKKLGPYIGAIILMKGKIEGYKLVLDLLNFDYDAVIWYLQSPKGLPHTIALDVSLESSEIPQPYFVFQKIKLFTQDYLYPIIFPLGYNYDVSIDDLASTAKAKFHPSYDGFSDFSLDNSLLLGNSKLYLQSPDSTIWNVRVSNTGILSTTPITEVTEPSEPFRFYGNYSGSGALYILTIDDSGDITAIISDDENIPIWKDFYLPDNRGTAWQLPFNGIDLIAPIINSIEVPNDALYLIGDYLIFTVNFSENVIVSGTPRIKIQMLSGDVYANYISGSNTSTLTFRYIVRENDSSLSGIVIENSIDLNNGTIRDLARNDSFLNYIVPNTSGIIVDGVLPIITSVDTPTPTFYLENDNLDFRVNFNKAINVGGLPRIKINLESGDVYAIFESESIFSSPSLLFRYTVANGDSSINNNIIVNPTIDLNGGNLIDDSGYEPLLNLGSVDTTAIRVDALSPFIVSVSPPPAGVYKYQLEFFDALNFVVEFNEVVFVYDSIPRIQLELDSGIVYADYISGSGTNLLIFSYVIQDLDSSSNVVVVPTLDLNGSIISDGRDLEAILEFETPDMTGVIVDSLGPSIVSITPPASIVYFTDDIFNFTLNFDENVIVSGTPQLAIQLDSGIVYADYISGSGTQSLTFSYTVIETDEDNDGITLISPLELNSGSLVDIYDNNANLNFTIPDTSSIYVNSDIVLPNTGTSDEAWINLASGNNKFGGIVFDVKVQSDGKILVGGAFTSYDSNTNYKRLIRLNPDGSLDTNFMANVENKFSSVVYSIHVQDDGKILVGGQFTNYSGVSNRNFLVRLNNSGQIDETFCTAVVDGKFNRPVRKVIGTQDDSIIVAGDFFNYDLYLDFNRIIKINSDLTIDPTFRTNVTGKFNSSIASITNVIELSDGSLIVIGNNLNYSNNTNKKIIKLSSIGNEVNTFSNNAFGIFSYDFSTQYFDALAIDSSDNIYIGGLFKDVDLNIGMNNLIKLNSNGQIDGTFTSNSSVSAKFDNRIYSLHVDTNDNIFVGGDFNNYNSVTGRSKFIKLNTSGVVDDTFCSSAVDDDKFNDIVHVITESNGALYVGGRFTDYNSVTGRSRLLKFT